MEVKRVFYPKPMQWGLRGDPYLWEELELKMALVHQPTSVSAFEALLKGFAEEILGASLEKGKHIFVKAYDKGGMSSGHVSCTFWLETAFPLLLERFELLELSKQ